MLKKTLDVICDPINKIPLKLLDSKIGDNNIVSGKLVGDEKHQYEIINGIADLTPKKEEISIQKNILSSWGILQENGLKLYQEFPDSNLSTDKRKVVKLFKEFCSFSGKVLDVGCGPVIPGYLKNNSDIELAIGIDPLLSSYQTIETMSIDLLKAFGEFLPFLDETFDAVCFGSSYDHFMEPLMVLNETRRILRPNGVAMFWNGASNTENNNSPKKKSFVKKMLQNSDRNNPVQRTIRKVAVSARNKMNSVLNMESVKEREIIKSLPVPDNAFDQFHLRSYNDLEFQKFCTKAKFERIEKEKLPELNSIFSKYKVIDM